MPDGIVLFATFLYGGMSFFGLVFYIPFIVTVIRNPSMRRNSFYCLAASLGVADCMFLCITLFYVTPVTYAQRDLGGARLNSLVGWMVQLCWFPTLPTILCLAVDRYFTICHGKLAVQKFFGGKKVYIWIAVCWIFGLSIGLPSFDDCCYLTYSAADFSWFYSDAAGSQIISKLELFIVAIVVVCSLLMNSVVFRNIWKQHNQISTTLSNTVHSRARHRREVGMFVQFFILVLLLVLFDGSLNVLPHFTDHEYLGLLISFTYLLNSSANGYVYFALNKQVRHSVLHLYHLRKEPATEIAVSQITSKAPAKPN